MGLLIPLLAVLGSFGIPLYALKIYGDGRRHKRELEARKLLPAGGGEDVKKLTEENKLLRERVENLESIVCSVDFELNQKLAKVIDEQRSLMLPGATGAPHVPSVNDPTPSPPRITGGGLSRANPPGAAAALERTATAMAKVATPPLTTSLEAGQVLAQ